MNLKWAVAGRSEAKLKQLVSECQTLKPDRTLPEIEVCNVNDEELATLARKTFCLITTLGPYSRYGEHAFKACAEAGTHYIDCTGEVPFTMTMIQKYENAAKASGAWMFPQSGLESAPSDLLTLTLATIIRSELASPTSDVVVDLHRLDSTPSGGTFASFLTMFETFPARVLLEALKPYTLSPKPNNHPGPKKSFLGSVTGVHRIPGLGLLSTSPTGAMNAALVCRSWGLMQQEDGLPKDLYGPNFTYQEFMKAPNALVGLMLHYTLMTTAPLLLLPPARALIRKLTFKPGDGPDKEKSKKDIIEFRAVAKPDASTDTNKQAFGRLAYTGSMYYLTALILAQGAATILQDDSVKLTGGIYTPACLGQGFIDRIVGAGVNLETEIREI
ncbi:putative saccharopine dehydrogenase protein [Phaeoacremonium minimum UCRPA7]|uniref:Putative saccharopine dehydrogenase protein n=1 Tax=Phaeoacremonium minimum (strain UCR-PA7) TaxID=1286976 RepID=R8BQW8_PHAM7|nr:putative saccharopine dehydrogenase protein [Phaeoacremonium minimum UCRPA7]EOO01751.1 putative saccharopine dehydrogenase protein [Phaeoacremonium minimum UCRPA7]